MAGDNGELLAAVREQAEARVRSDVKGYAKHLTAEGLETLRSSFPGFPPRVSGYEIVEQRPEGRDQVFDVRYQARDSSFVVRSRWRRQAEGWRVVHAERLWREGEKRPGVLSRLAGSLARALARRRGR